MWWLVLVLVVVGVVLTTVTLVVRRGDALPASDVDPIFVAGISIAGASAALLATLGVFALPMTAVGLVCIVVGVRRSHVGRDHRRRT